jgi:ABC-type glycerol-3-phosphate transport system substrate-binding protein
MKHAASIALALGFLLLNRAATAQDLAKAKEEGHLVFYTSWGPADADYVVKAFEKKYPFLKVEPVRASSEKTLHRLLTEQRANRFLGDVVAVSGIQSAILKEKAPSNVTSLAKTSTSPPSGAIRRTMALDFIRRSTSSAITQGW